MEKAIRTCEWCTTEFTVQSMVERNFIHHCDNCFKEWEAAARKNSGKFRGKPNPITAEEIMARMVHLDCDLRNQLYDANKLIEEQSKVIEEHSKTMNFYDNVVANLRKEADILSNRLTKWSNSGGDFAGNGYIATVKALKEVLALIKEYDWKLYCSEYKKEYDDGTGLKWVPEVSVWEQNHDGEIRNHRKWLVQEIKPIV